MGGKKIWRQMSGFEVQQDLDNIQLDLAKPSNIIYLLDL
jgi:hypothetical protein